MSQKAILRWPATTPNRIFSSDGPAPQLLVGGSMQDITFGWMSRRAKVKPHEAHNLRRKQKEQSGQRFPCWSLPLNLVDHFGAAAGDLQLQF